jgi:hypothetical protein
VTKTTYVPVSGHMQVKDLSVHGQVHDLYDYDYNEDYYGSAGATVQAGFGTIGFSGHIFDSVVTLNNSLELDLAVSAI